MLVLNQADLLTDVQATVGLVFEKLSLPSLEVEEEGIHTKTNSYGNRGARIDK